MESHSLPSWLEGDADALLVWLAQATASSMTAKVQPLYASPAPLDDSRFETIMQFMALAASLCISAEQSAYRGNREEVGRYLAQARMTVDNSFKVFDALGRSKP